MMDTTTSTPKLHKHEPTRVIVARAIVCGLALVFSIGALTQFFLVGLSMFDDPGHWLDHKNVGHGLGIIARLIWIPALLGRMGRSPTIATIALAIMFEAQYGFIEFDNATVKALHPVNGAVLFALATWITGQTFALLRRAARTTNRREHAVIGNHESLEGRVQ